MGALFVAARQPIALAVVVVAIVTGLTVAWWLLPLGVLVYLVMVVLASRDPALATTARRATTHTRLTSKTFRAIIDEIDRSQRDIERSIGQARGPLANILQPIANNSRDLVDQAHVLAGKGQIIEQYLAQINYHQIQDEINKLDARMNQTSDPYTQQQLQQTRQALVSRQSNARDMETFIGRIMAQLQNIDANLDNILSETVRLRTTDAVSATSTSNQVAENLQHLNADMSAFRQVLDTALVQSGAPTT